MSCVYPMLAVADQLTDRGYPVPGTTYKMIGRYDPDIARQTPGALKLPCGKCVGCRAQKCRDWADRMILELDHSKKAVFLTLTYNDDNLPVKMQVSTGQCEPTLQKRDLTLFFKRLRKHFRDKEIRYYAVGEYGSNTKRPHYHIILFGVGLDDFPDLRAKGTNELRQLYYISDFLSNDIWKLGFCLLAPVSWNTCAYVARYVKKKDFGLVSDEFVQRSREPEYSVMSRRPGIGAYYYEDHPDKINFTQFSFSDGQQVVEVKLPQMLLNKLKDLDYSFYMELKEQRKRAANDYEMSKLMQTDLSSMEYAALEEEKLNTAQDIIDFYRGL